MGFSVREQQVFSEIQNWEYQLSQQESTDFQMTFDKWMNEALRGRQDEFFSKIDEWLFYLHAFIQSSQSQLDARNRILENARLFDDTIEHIEDLKKLTIDQLIYMTEHQIARHRLYSFVQGSVSGTGGMLLAADLPMMVAINLKAVQLIATTYGHDVNRPYEMMVALKVFHAALMPPRLQQHAWEEMIQEVQKERSPFFYEGTDEVINTATMQLLGKQLLKTFVVHLVRKKMLQGIPLLGIAVGSTVNYRLTRSITIFTHRFYQMRYLLQKKEDE